MLHDFPLNGPGWWSRYLRATSLCMRKTLLPAVVLLLSACGPTSVPQQEQGTPAPDTTATPPAPPVTDWPGYYNGILPCADCPGIETSLWLRSDSTYVLQRHYQERDTIPWGYVGQWRVVNGLLWVGGVGDKPDFFRRVKDGLEEVDEIGRPFADRSDLVLNKLADEIKDDTPRMRLSGAYRYLADAYNFRPCGSPFTWPCAAGLGVAEEEGEAEVPFTNADLEKRYRKAVKNGGDPWTIEVIGHLGMGPAMEGEGMDEYLYIHQVLRPIDPGSCP